MRRLTERDLGAPPEVKLGESRWESVQYYARSLVDRAENIFAAANSVQKETVLSEISAALNTIASILGQFPDMRSAYVTTGKAAIQTRHTRAQESRMTEAAGDQYHTINDASRLLHDQNYSKGPMGVWYAKDEFLRDYMMGSDWMEKHNTPFPDPTNLEATHVFLGRINTSWPEDTFEAMQGENWSPNGEARSMIRSLGIGHTSASVGDVFQMGNGKPVMVDTHGYYTLTKQPAGSRPS